MEAFYNMQQSSAVKDVNGLTPVDLYELLLKCWSAETCAPRMRNDWSPENPTLGQCSITAFLVQDMFGGKVFGVPLGDGNFHCFNEVNGCRFDLTSAQFGDQKLNYEDCPEQRREVHFAKEEKHQRYMLLRKRFLAEMAVKLKHSGCNCCQAVLCSYAHGIEGIPLKAMGAGFGTGMGCLEATCGALCGAQMLQGLKLYKGRPILPDAKALYASFREKCGATLCRELKGVGTGKVLCECDDCVRNAIYALEERQE